MLELGQFFFIEETFLNIYRFPQNNDLTSHNRNSYSQNGITLFKIIGAM
jgi:hypothetical protein